MRLHRFEAAHQHVQQPVARVFVGLLLHTFEDLPINVFGLRCQNRELGIELLTQPGQRNSGGLGNLPQFN